MLAAKSTLHRIFFAYLNIITEVSSQMLLWMLLCITEFLFQQNVLQLQSIPYLYLWHVV